jgi:hypothetical protein
MPDRHGGLLAAAAALVRKSARKTPSIAVSVELGIRVARLE